MKRPAKSDEQIAASLLKTPFVCFNADSKVSRVPPGWLRASLDQYRSGKAALNSYAAHAIGIFIHIPFHDARH